MGGFLVAFLTATQGQEGAWSGVNRSHVHADTLLHLNRTRRIVLKNSCWVTLTRPN
jgi:hypothetical protein